METGRALDILAETAARCGQAADLDEVLEPLLERLAGLGLRHGTLALLDEGVIRIEAAHGLSPADRERAPEAGLLGEVIAEDAALHARIPSVQDWAGVRQRGAALAAAPLRSDGRCVGALGAYRLLADEAAIEADLQLLTALAALLAPLARRRLHRYALQQPLPAEGSLQPDNLIGRSKAMRLVFELLGQVAGSATTVLLRGESGTGKELVAQALHHHSPRARGPFIKVNCAALPEGVIESELFGHEKGSFTGALQQRKGRFERARGGTLFLDEIGDLSPATQVKLLRVLQEGEFERVGGLETVQSDARIIAATSRDLEAMIEAGTFRADLYYRLNVFPIWLPPLRERKVDILLLADHFVGVCNRVHGRQVRRISTSAIDMLMAYHWPGNVRELENCIERATLLARDDVILGHHLPPTLQTAEASGTAAQKGLKAQVAAFEKELILDALKSTRGNMAKAAEKLEITERIMGLRVREHGIDPRRFREKKR